MLGRKSLGIKNYVQIIYLSVSVHVTEQAENSYSEKPKRTSGLKMGNYSQTQAKPTMPLK